MSGRSGTHNLPRPRSPGHYLAVVNCLSRPIPPLGSDYILSDLRPMISIARQLPKRV